MSEINCLPEEETKTILAKYPDGQKRSAVMPLLYLAQRTSGWISQETMREIAEILEISTTDVASIAGFYSLFHEEPGGHYRIQVCTDLPCALRGSEKFMEELCALLGVDPGGTTADGLFTVEEVKCLAACNRTHVFQVQGDNDCIFYENQTLDTARLVINDLRSRAQGLHRGPA